MSSTLWGGDLVGVHSEVLSTGHTVRCCLRGTWLLCDWQRSQSPGMMCGGVLAVLKEGQHLVTCLIVEPERY